MRATFKAESEGTARRTSEVHHARPLPAPDCTRAKSLHGMRDGGTTQTPRTPCAASIYHFECCVTERDESEEQEAE